MNAEGSGERGWNAMNGYTDTERMIRNEGEHPDCFRKLPLYERAAATYSPTWWGSTIGASELNFSVRYG